MEGGELLLFALIGSHSKHNIITAAIRENLFGVIVLVGVKEWSAAPVS